MESYEAVVDWQIAQVERMPKEEQKTFYENLVNSYKREMNELKKIKKQGDKVNFLEKAWKTVLLSTAIGAFASSILMAKGGNLEVAGNAVAAYSILGFPASVVGLSLKEDINPIAAKDAKAKIKEINNKPTMTKR